MEQQVIDKIEIVGDFMGMKKEVSASWGYVWSDKETDKILILGEYRPNKDWNELMSAVKKFDYLAENKAIPFLDDYEYWCDKIDDAVTRTYEIEPVFKVLVEAIEWYNTQTK